MATRVGTTKASNVAEGGVAEVAPEAAAEAGGAEAVKSSVGETAARCTCGSRTNDMAETLYVMMNLCCLVVMLDCAALATWSLLHRFCAMKECALHRLWAVRQAIGY